MRKSEFIDCTFKRCNLINSSFSKVEFDNNLISFIGGSKYVMVGFCLTLAYVKSASAIDVAVPKGNTTAVDPTVAPRAATKVGGSFAPIVALGLGASPQVRTAILIGATGAVCYLAFTGDDKSLYVACGLLASKLGETFKN